MKVKTLPSTWLLAAVVVGLAAGCLLAMQSSVNGYLGQNVAHPMQASFISFLSGTAIILVINFFTRSFPPRFTAAPTSLPWWAWMGGAIGVVMVTTSLIIVPKVGSLPWFAALMTGQTIMAIILDHWGLLGNPRSPASPIRLVGAGLLIVGVLVIVQAKRSEQQQPPPGITDSISESQ